jgi:hypothetical protein
MVRIISAAADKAPGVPGHNYNDCTDSRAALALSKPAPCGFFVFWMLP